MSEINFSFNDDCNAMVSTLFSGQTVSGSRSQSDLTVSEEYTVTCQGVSPVTDGWAYDWKNRPRDASSP